MEWLGCTLSILLAPNSFFTAAFHLCILNTFELNIHTAPHALKLFKVEWSVSTTSETPTAERSWQRSKKHKQNNYRSVASFYKTVHNSILHFRASYIENYLSLVWKSNTALSDTFEIMRKTYCPRHENTISPEEWPQNSPTMQKVSTNFRMT